MAVLKNSIMKYFKFNKLLFSCTEAYSTHDRHLDYFRNTNGYKNSLIPLNNEKIIFNDTELSCLKGKTAEIDSIFYNLLQRENALKLTMPQLKDTVFLMANSNIDIEKYENALKYIDEKCALSVDKWPLDFSLYVLDAWFIVLGPKAFRKHYYYALTNLLDKKIKRCSKYNLLLTLYFVGLSKRSPPFFMELMEYKLEKFISEFSDSEWAIACLSFFKTSTKMNSSLLLQQCCKSAENLMIENDHFNLISILKCLRLSEYYDNNLMSMLTEYVKRKCTVFNFVECTNILAAFATQNVYNSEVYNSLESQGISQLSKETPVKEFDKSIQKIHPSERSRMKDIARFLWGMAFVGHDINQTSINFIIEVLNARLNSGEIQLNMLALIDCLQSLILCGHYPLNMIEYVLKPTSLKEISNIRKVKPKYQLYFINRCAYIENYVTEIKNEAFMNNIPKSLQKEISERKGYSHLIDYLNIYLNKNSFTCCYIIPHIMISGIFIATNYKDDNLDREITPTLLKLIDDGVVSKSIQDILYMNKVYTCIELLDSSVCARESIMPIGLMKTKIRQLQKLNINVITITSHEVNTLEKSNKQICSKLQNLIM